MATTPDGEMQHHGLMGREARRKAEQRELKRQKTADPEAFTLATAADEAFARAIPSGWRTDWAGFDSAERSQAGSDHCHTETCSGAGVGWVVPARFEWRGGPSA